MNPEAKPCHNCPVKSDWCIPEKRASLIVDQYQLNELTIAQAKHKVSVMTQEARKLGCPKKEILQIRRKTLGQIDPKLEEADRRIHTWGEFVHKEADIFAANLDERSIGNLSGEIYDTYLRNTKDRK